MILSEKYPHIQFKKHWKLSPTCLYKIGECSALIEAISRLPIQPDYHQVLLNVSLRKGARATTAIEGNTLTEREIEIIQKGQSLPPSKEYQEIEVKNILAALNKLLNEVVNKNKISMITPNLLKRFHKMVGKGLGKHFDAIPGKLRTDQRIVGTYRAPDHEDVVPLVERFCKWLKEEFHFGKSQHFIDSVIQAIVTHVYIEWIHPFADGNGRTGRLVEFYVLLRSGTPDIASHILSNFYNDTRPEYYRRLDEACKTQKLTSFIEYAVQGYRDGLIETLEIIRASLFEISWQKLIYDSFANKKYVKKKAFKRKRDLILQLPTDKELTLEEIVLINPKIARNYASLSERTVDRDLKELQEMKLIVKHDDKYRANVNLLRHMIARKI